MTRMRRASLYSLSLWAPRKEFLIAKKRLGGTAALWLRAEPDAFTRWLELKRALIEEFSEVQGEYPEKHEDVTFCESLTEYEVQLFTQVSRTATLEGNTEKEELTSDTACHITESCTNQKPHLDGSELFVTSEIATKSQVQDQENVYKEQCESTADYSHEENKGADLKCVRIRSEYGTSQQLEDLDANDCSNYVTAGRDRRLLTSMRDYTRGHTRTGSVRNHERSEGDVVFYVFVCVWKYWFFIYGILMSTYILSEVTAALAALKAKKAPGPDQLTAELLKAMGSAGVNALLRLCNDIWHSGEWPSDWTRSVILPLHKKGSTTKCDNYRTLALISHASKVLLHIINNRIRHFLDWQIPQEQAGFVKGKGTREQILNIRQIIEKAYEFNTPIILCFIDYSKAFDCVVWDTLWKVLRELGDYILCQ